VHYSGHGVVGSNADLSHLQLEGGTVTAIRFANSRLGATAQPFLFLNACTLGRGGKVLGRQGGFAGSCIEGGWSGVIASYWPVYDASATQFALEFYQKLKQGRGVGESLQQLRAEKPDDPTAQSYALFGDPFARLQFD
jgi:CHAT domain-containing protein